MAGQVAYHLLAQAGAARAPWPVTTLVSCLPVLVLAMGTALAHMLRADAHTTADALGDGTRGPATSPPPGWSAEDHSGPAREQTARTEAGPPARTITIRQADQDPTDATGAPGLPTIGQAHLAARRLAAAGKPVSRRALRSEGVRGSNQALNALARAINAELADETVLPARLDHARV